MIAQHLVIRGRVQGVGYRYAMTEVAETLGVTGWVRNRRDGTVEALFAGDDRKVEEMIGLCAEGPTRAKVTEVQRFAAVPPDEPGFRQLPTE